MAPKRTLEEGEEAEFEVSGLIDAGDSDDEINFAEGEVVDMASSSEAEDESEEDSEAELNKLLAEEEAEDSDGSENSEEYATDATSITDKLSGMKLRRLSSQGSKAKWADGTSRIIKPEIDPVYDSDDSDREDVNRIGNIPLSVYEEYPHIGYDINGKRIMRPAKGSALDQLLETIDVPEGWTGLLDKETGKSLNLSEEELELIRKIEANDNVDGINPYEPTIEWFTSDVMETPLQSLNEPKRRFVKSKSEAKRIMKLVKAIREGKIVPRKSREQESEEEDNFDLWEGADDETDANRALIMRAPKLRPPTNDESYNPPEEYLPTDEERKTWEETEPEARRKNYLPQKYGALRKVPGYGQSINERFNRCLDLYLAPRVVREKSNIDPESLLPELPSPKDLRPFPVRTSTIYEGHKGRIRAMAVDPSGNWLATASDDGTVKVWEVLTARQIWSITLIKKPEDEEDHIEALAWNPQPDVRILAIACGSSIYLVIPPIYGYEIENKSLLKIEDGWGYAKTGDKTNMNVNEDDETTVEATKNTNAKWVKPTKSQAENDISCVITASRGTEGASIKNISWHRAGDYFVTVSPQGGNKASVLIHQLSKHASQSPFSKAKGIIMDAQFHPSKPELIVMSQRYIRIYNLQLQKLEKKLVSGASWLSCMDIHRSGDHIVSGSFDKRVIWHDLDLGSTPYKTLRYQDKAVRSVAFHKGGLPLFCSASDDGSIDVFHATVYDDFMTNPLLVPLKKLKGHSVVDHLGVLKVCWHPKEAWLFSAGADNTARLWTN